MPRIQLLLTKAKFLQVNSSYLHVLFMKASVKLRNLRIAPRKMQLVVDSIRGKQVADALRILKFQRKKGAPYIYKLILSALASWQQKYEDANIDEYAIYISEVYVTQGRAIKRFKPAPQGRAHPIKKYFNHVFLTVNAVETEDIQESEEAEKE